MTLPEKKPRHSGERPRGICCTSTTPPGGRADLRLVPPPANDPESWIRLMNLLFVSEEDDLFVWARGVRAAVEASA